MGLMWIRYDQIWYLIFYMQTQSIIFMQDSGINLNWLIGNCQSNFADMFAALHQSVRCGNIFQGKAGRDEGFNLFAFDQRPEARNLNA